MKLSKCHLNCHCLAGGWAERVRGFRSVWLLILVGIAICGSALSAQSKPATETNRLPDTTAHSRFAAVSIRKSARGNPTRTTLTPSPDGYRAVNQPLAFAIMLAYEPQLNLWSQDSVPLNLPNWAKDDSYDIQAKIDPVDTTQWQRQGPENRMLKAMLQSMLEDRCKLIAHWVPTETTGYALMASKRGLRLKKAVPGEPIPPNGNPVMINLAAVPGATYYPIRPGETRTTFPFYNVSMQVLAQWLSESSRVYIVDKTGLSGGYDFVLTRLTAEEASASDPGPPIKYDINALGLKLVPVKVPTGRLMIDHLERPTPN